MEKNSVIARSLQLESKVEHLEAENAALREKAAVLEIANRAALGAVEMYRNLYVNLYQRVVGTHLLDDLLREKLGG